MFLLLLMSCLRVSAEPVSGRVLDPHGRAVPAADILLLRGRVVAAAVKANREGAFGPVDVPPGEYVVLASAPGLRLAPRAVVVPPGGTLAIDLSLSLAAVGESLVVSASQVETPLSRVTDSVTVLSRAELDARQIHTVAEALRLVPGLGVFASGGPGAVTSLFPRGGESDYTLVLVDGVPQNDFGGRYDAAHLATAPVERIEVVRGPQTALHGNGAIGAIVHIITRRGGRPSAHASIEGGGYGTTNVSASTTGRAGPWAWGGALERFATDGDTRVFPSAGGPVRNDDYARSSGTVSLEWTRGRDRRLMFQYRRSDYERGSPGPYGSDPLGLYGGVDAVSRGFGTSHSAAATGTFATAGVRHHAGVTLARFETDFVSPFSADPSFDRTRRDTVRYQADIERTRVGVSAGADWLHERSDNTFVTGEAGTPVPISRSIGSAFVELRTSALGRLFLTTGVRADHIVLNAVDADPFGFSGRPAFPKHALWSTNPKISIVWMLRQPDVQGWTKVRLGAGTGIKSPNTFDLAFTDNPALQPERSRSFDAGVEHAAFGARLLAAATFFTSTFDDLIVTVPFGSTNDYQSDNIANARARGVELEASWRGPAGITVRGSLTFLDTEILAVDGAPGVAPPPYEVGEPLIRRPARQGSVDVTWTRGRVSAFALLTGRGDVTDFEPSFAAAVYTNPAYAALAVGGAVKIAGGLELFGRLTNALDRGYEEISGFPARGRAAYGGIRIAAGR
jgi:outer membrane cobalamin receptor